MLLSVVRSGHFVGADRNASFPQFQAPGDVAAELTRRVDGLFVGLFACVCAGRGVGTYTVEEAGIAEVASAV
jgi:hypothetical protein